MKARPGSLFSTCTVLRNVRVFCFKWSMLVYSIWGTGTVCSGTKAALTQMEDLIFTQLLSIWNRHSVVLSQWLSSCCLWIWKEGKYTVILPSTLCPLVYWRTGLEVASRPLVYEFASLFFECCCNTGLTNIYQCVLQQEKNIPLHFHNKPIISWFHCAFLCC